MKIIRHWIPFVLLLLLSLSVSASKQQYNATLVELNNMIEGKQAINFKKAVFDVENTYSEGKLSYTQYCGEISQIASKVKGFMKARQIERYKTAGNYAVYTYMTEASNLNGNKAYTYDFEDFMGNKDWTKMFVTKLMRTHSGNCRSLPYFYKILAEEINVQACLALAPQHCYIKHLGEDGKWANIELTNGSFSRDEWIISQMSISTTAIKSGMYTDALTQKQSIVECILDLANGYINQYGKDDFIVKCYKIALKYHPVNARALSLKAIYLKEKIKKLEKAGPSQSSKGPMNFTSSILLSTS